MRRDDAPHPGVCMDFSEFSSAPGAGEVKSLPFREVCVTGW